MAEFHINTLRAPIYRECLQRDRLRRSESLVIAIISRLERRQHLFGEQPQISLGESARQSAKMHQTDQIAKPQFTAALREALAHFICAAHHRTATPETVTVLLMLPHNVIGMSETPFLPRLQH